LSTSPSAPPEDRDDLLELAGLLRAERGVVDHQCRQRHLHLLAPLDSAQEEIEQDARVRHHALVVEVLQQQEGQLWEDQHGC